MPNQQYLFPASPRYNAPHQMVPHHHTNALNYKELSKLADDRYDNLPKLPNLKNRGKALKLEDIDIALHMLTTHMARQDIEPLVTALETLRTEPQNESFREKVVETFNDLGVLQGAALTYAPYLCVFLSDDPFADD